VYDVYKKTVPGRGRGIGGMREDGEEKTETQTKRNLRGKRHDRVTLEGKYRKIKDNWMGRGKGQEGNLTITERPGGKTPPSSGVLQEGGGIWGEGKHHENPSKSLGKELKDISEKVDSNLKKRGLRKKRNKSRQKKKGESKKGR